MLSANIRSISVNSLSDFWFFFHRLFLSCMLDLTLWVAYIILCAFTHNKISINKVSQTVPSASYSCILIDCTCVTIIFSCHCSGKLPFCDHCMGKRMYCVQGNTTHKTFISYTIYAALRYQKIYQNTNIINMYFYIHIQINCIHETGIISKHSDGMVI